MVGLVIHLHFSPCRLSVEYVTARGYRQMPQTPKQAGVAVKLCKGKREGEDLGKTRP